MALLIQSVGKRIRPSSLPLCYSPACQLRRRSSDSASAFHELELDSSAKLSKEDVKAVYLKLAKRYHPDSMTQDGNAERFMKIREAYAVCMKTLQTEASREEKPEIILENELNELDSTLGFKRFRQVQHRHYLTYDSAGTGNMAERQRAHQQRRLDIALENIFDRKYQKAMANPDEKAVAPRDKSGPKHFPGRWDLSQRKLTGSIERLAEDLIQEAMARGDFDNVKGKVLDLSQPVDHFVDNSTFHLNKVLISSGFAPEWAVLGKEIGQGIEDLRVKISETLSQLSSQSRNGGDELSLEELERSPQWKKCWGNWEENVIVINKKIAKFNLLVPTMAQQKGTCNLHTLFRKVFDQNG